MKLETRYLVSYRRRVLFTEFLNAAPLQSGFGFVFFFGIQVDFSG